jgi:hypothetical protein
VISSANKIYANFTHNIQELGSGDTLMNFTLYYPVDVLKLLLQIELNVQKDKNHRSYERQLIKTTRNFCKMTEGVMGDFIARTIMHDFNSKN